MSSYIEGRVRSRNSAPDAFHGSGWFQGESSLNRNPRQRNMSSPTACDDFSFEEQRAIRELWNAKASEEAPQLSMCTLNQAPGYGCDRTQPSDVIVIILQRIEAVVPTFMPAWEVGLANYDAIVINPMAELLGLSQKLSSEQPVLPSEAHFIPPKGGGSLPDTSPPCLSLEGSQHPISTKVSLVQVIPPRDVVNPNSLNA
jgi:hypothetical protein